VTSLEGRFEGKVCIVLGAASGIGRATAELMAREGGRVMIADRDAAGAAAVAAEIGDHARSIGCDVTEEPQVVAALQACSDAFGELEVVVNNAGVAPAMPLVEHEVKTFEQVYAVNVIGVFLGIKHAVAHLTARGGGAIVSTASVAGLRGGRRNAAYASSKAAVINLTQTAALELRDLNIRVNCVCPGIIDTPLLRSHGPSANRGDRLRAIQGRMGAPDDIARAIAYLASDEADFISGHALLADNALTAGLFA
jgi:NAD(P)-dependent dehydrogenase (short-subunit alcohol dehydrogenase family)